MRTARLFAAVDFAAEEKEEMYGLGQRLRPLCTAGRMSRAQLLHVTLHFFGQTPLDRAEAIGRAMERAAGAFRPFALETGQAGTFGGGGGVLWLGLSRGGESLRQLQAALERELAAEGFHPEGRPFRAHITLGRDVRLQSSARLSEVELPAVALGVGGITLLESTQVSGRLEYVPLLRAALREKI